MPPFFHLSLQLCWLCIGFVWLLTAFRTKATAQGESWLRRLIVWWGPLIITIVLLGPGEWYGRSLLREQFIAHTTLVYSIGLLLCLAGTVLSIWARLALAGNWSATVEIKQDHTLIEKGPYRIVRHPIYAGLLLLFLGNTLMVGDWRGVLAMVIITTSFAFKLKREEAMLAQRFGKAYADYRSRTSALLPPLI